MSRDKFRWLCRLISAFVKVWQGILERNLKIFTFEAGMCMKTNKVMTKFPKKVGHLLLSFGHFRLTDTNFAEIWGELTLAYNNPHGQTAIPDVLSGESSRKVSEGEFRQKCRKFRRGWGHPRYNPGVRDPTVWIRVGAPLVGALHKGTHEGCPYEASQV
jgi:hypothetical protein